MDKVKLQEMIKEEVQSLLSEADMRSPAQKLQSLIRRLNASGDETQRAIAAELIEISNELEGR
jgi:hypothetical protein|tara:strand:+ start:3871 stop:4059 length:189 start_codon:yes stop_codon:yes gene_type:complete